MTRRLIVGAVMAAVAGLSAAGCSGGGDDKPESGAEVAWAGKICDAVGRGSANLQMPTFPNTRDARAVRDGYLKFLNDVGARLATVQTSLRAAGAPPVPQGQEAYNRALRNLQTAKNALNGATAELRKARTTNIKQFERSVARLGKVMEAYSSYEGPVKDLRSNPAMNTAFNKASSCVANKL